MAHRGNRGTAIPFHDHGTKRGEGSTSRSGRSLPSGKTRYPFYRRLGGPQSRSGQVRKISPQPGFDPRTVQHVASRYTNYATGSANYEGTRENSNGQTVSKPHRKLLVKKSRYIALRTGYIFLVAKPYILSSNAFKFPTPLYLYYLNYRLCYSCLTLNACLFQIPLLFCNIFHLFIFFCTQFGFGLAPL